MKFRDKKKKESLSSSVGLPLPPFLVMDQPRGRFKFNFDKRASQASFNFHI